MARRTTRSANPSLIATRLSGTAASRPLTPGMLPSGAPQASGRRCRRCRPPRGILGGMTSDVTRERAIYQALKAVDEVAAALQSHLIEEHGADPERTAPQGPATNSFKLLRQARERLGLGLRAVEADHIAESDEISLRRTTPA